MSSPSGQVFEIFWVIVQVSKGVVSSSKHQRQGHVTHCTYVRNSVMIEYLPYLFTIDAFCEQDRVVRDPSISVLGKPRQFVMYAGDLFCFVLFICLLFNQVLFVVHSSYHNCERCSFSRQNFPVIQNGKHIAYFYLL